MVQMRDFSNFEKFIRLCAGRVGQILDTASLANDVGVSPNTITHWISILEASFIIFRLQPYFENFGKRLIKSPKLYFMDTGLLCWLLGIESENQLSRDSLYGGVFENMVILEALKYRLNRGKEPGAYYFRDNHGNEIDLVLTYGRMLKAIEIKSAQTFSTHFLKGITYFNKLVGDRSLKGGIVYSGSEERSTEHYDLVNFLKSPNLFS
jgi:predicted AAA+ superfamily ATPase